MEERESLDGEIDAHEEKRSADPRRRADARGNARGRRTRDRRRGRGRDGRARRRSREHHARRSCATTRPGGAREPRRGCGEARRHHVPGLPPVDPVDRGGTDPPVGGRRRRVLRQLRRHPRPVTQPVLPFEPSDPTRLDEVVIYCDGGSRGNPGPAAIGAVVSDPSTEPPAVLATVSETIGVTTNNVAEYQACIAGLPRPRRTARDCVRVRADSLLMIRQLRGEYRVKQAAPRAAARRSPAAAAELRGGRPAARAARSRTSTPTRSSTRRSTRCPRR